jgi:hypothetical protein
MPCHRQHQKGHLAGFCGRRSQGRRYRLPRGGGERSAAHQDSRVVAFEAVYCPGIGIVDQALRDFVSAW